MDYKKLLKSTLRGRKIDRPLFLPLIGTYLTKVSQSTIEETYQDPGILYQSLRDTQALLNYDVVVTPLDVTLEAEAFGCSLSWSQGGTPVIQDYLPTESPVKNNEEWLNNGRIPIFIEAIKRFAEVEGKKIPVIASITGPLTVSQQIYGEHNQNCMDGIVQSLISLVKAYADAGVDGIMINEELIDFNGDFQSQMDYYKPILNTIRHYNIQSIQRFSQNQTAFDIAFNYSIADGIISPTELSLNDAIFNGKSAIGISLNNQSLHDIDSADSISFISGKNRTSLKRLFITTEKPINQEDIELDRLQESIERIKQLF